MYSNYFKSVGKVFLLLLFSFHFTSKAQDFQLSSLDGKLRLFVKHENGFVWQLLLEEEEVISSTAVSMTMDDGRVAGSDAITNQKTHAVKEIIRPEIPYKNALIIDHYNTLELQTGEGFEIQFRLYNDGLAYRFIDYLDISKTVQSEILQLTFPDGTKTYFPEEESMYSHNERNYLHAGINELEKGSFCSLPVLFETAKGAKVLLTETALHDYPNMFIEVNETQKLQAIFPHFVLEALPDTIRGTDRNEIIAKTAEYIAVVDGSFEYPWRVFIVGNDDKVLIESNLAYQLARPNVLEDIAWIKPGKVAWDWYNDNNIFGVDFLSGLNTETYKYYIDFASANSIEYVILDEGWTKSTTEILRFNPDMDVKNLISYAENKGVGIILWVLWKPLNENMTEILSTYKSWGARGIKVDFMQRSDQAMVSSYEAIAKEAAKFELLVDFHGAFKPAGLQRTYPNVLNFEGVRGAENNKWTDQITPAHNLIIPFIRMAAGPMDYTPGSMINAGKDDFAVNWSRPMSQGTRCHQLAMYVIYEAPLQMLCESPSNYLKEQESVDFITQIPVTWDETKVLEAKIGEYLVVARRKGTDWYIGAMTDWTSRSFEIDLDFISGSYDATIMQDGINANRHAQDYKQLKTSLAKNDKLLIDMKSGGGFAAILKAK
ncbi:MAG: glycoside hydrolase family 97 protein [Bacteroidales bacterium]|nr:glycoside hydrolase family 97 protein [Bacteroidales bacterium]